MKNLIRIAALTIALLAGNSSPAEQLAARARVIDGDTLSLGEQVIRLASIDAPELAQKHGDRAAGYLQGLIHGTEVVCRGEEFDAYDRLIAHCEAGGTDLGEALVEAGLALVFRKFTDEYSAEEDAARAAKRGVWADASFLAPWEYRAARWAEAEKIAPEGCPIKGNISQAGVRIYHTPYSRSYSRTRISEAKGERWFCDEAEALAAGWRAPLR